MSKNNPGGKQQRGTGADGGERQEPRKEPAKRTTIYEPRVYFYLERIALAERRGFNEQINVALERFIRYYTEEVNPDFDPQRYHPPRRRPSTRAQPSGDAGEATASRDRPQAAPADES